MKLYDLLVYISFPSEINIFPTWGTFYYTIKTYNLGISFSTLTKCKGGILLCTKLNRNAFEYFLLMHICIPTTMISVLFCSLCMLLLRSSKCTSRLKMNTLLVCFNNAARPFIMYILTINSLRCLASLKRVWRMLRWVVQMDVYHSLCHLLIYHWQNLLVFHST